VRALAVFVVATPCPLILAAPIALMSGLSRAARVGVVVKGAGTIERLGEARSVLLDKTGTITLGHPELDRVVATNGLPTGEILRLAASLDQVSAHPLAKALVAGAEAGNLTLALPEDAEEVFGRGMHGTVDGHDVLVGSASWLREHGIEVHVPAGLDGGAAKVLVGVDGTLRRSRARQRPAAGGVARARPGPARRRHPARGTRDRRQAIGRRRDRQDARPSTASTRSRRPTRSSRSCAPSARDRTCAAS